MACASAAPGSLRTALMKGRPREEMIKLAMRTVTDPRLVALLIEGLWSDRPVRYRGQVVTACLMPLAVARERQASNVKSPALSAR